jgi:hypothetical protein
MAVSKRAVHVVGVGMIPFTKPGASESYNVMGARAAQLALARQVEGARLALQHNLGLGGACVVTLYQKVST